MAGGISTHASGSENPASLISPLQSGVYTTLKTHHRSDLTDGQVRDLDPLQGKTLNYVVIGADKGVLFFEPLGRIRKSSFLHPENPSITRDMEFVADAIGFAGAHGFQKGSFGLSLSYVRASLAATDRVSGLPDETHLDTADGVRLNMGFLYPAVGATWGLLFQNIPGFLWWKDHRRDQLPVKIRIGNRIPAGKYFVLSLDGETRFTQEGADRENLLYVGGESSVNNYITLRAGAYGTSLNYSAERHMTYGLTIKVDNGAMISWASDTFEKYGEKIMESFISITLPFITTGSEK